MSGRVLLISGQAERYGADRSLLTLARGLGDRGWQVTVAVPHDGPLVDDLRDAGVEIVVADAGVIRRTLGFAGWTRLAVTFPVTTWRIARLARRFDIVHVNAAVITGGLVGARLSGRPVVGHLRESFAEHRREWRLLGRLLRWTTDRTIAVSEAIAAEAADVGLGRQTVVIHNSCDVPFEPLAAPVAPRVLQVGRINDWKGQGVLVDALAVLRDRGVVVEAAVAGDVFPGGEVHRDRLVAHIERVGIGDQVSLLGFVDRVGDLMRPGAIFVQPSTRPEPFGLALVEAMSRGMACVASAAGGPVDIVRDGVTGMLVSPGDPVALADAVERLWRDDALRLRMGEAAAADVRSRFSPEREVDACEKLYLSLLAR